MARKKAADDGGDETGEQQKAKPSETKAVISGAKLKKLMAAKRATTKDMHELMGTLGQSIKDATEHDNLHRKAFGWICQLDKLEPEKAADLIDSFLYYYDVSGIQKRVEAVQRMDFEGGDGDDDGEKADNVAKFPAAAGNA